MVISSLSTFNPQTSLSLTMDSSLKLQLTCGVIAIFFILIKLLKSRKPKMSGVELPEPSGALPIIGHLHKLGGGEPFFKLLATMAEKNGPIFKLRFGMHTTLVISGWEMARECFTTNDKSFASRPFSTANKYMFYDDAIFPFSPYGDYWREMRKIVSNELLSARRLEMLKHFRINEIGTSIKELYKRCENNKGGVGEPLEVEMKHWFYDLMYNVVFTMVAGKRYLGSVDARDEMEARKYQEALVQSLRYAELSALGDAFPFLNYFDIGGYRKEMKATAVVIDNFHKILLEEHKQKRKNGVTEGDQDFIDVLMTYLEQAEPFSKHDNETIIKSTMLAMFLGGTDTSAITLSWFFSSLLNNPDMLKKAQQEIDAHVGLERNVEEADITNFVYLQAVMKETLRLYPPAPLSIPHETLEDCVVAGYNVRAGTRVIVNLWKLQKDPSVWSDPEEFRPERFLTTHADVNFRGQHFELLPFGSGRRSCPGISFTMQIMTLTLARLIHGFNMRTPSGLPVDMTPVSAGATMPRASSLETFFTPRLPAHLYG
ncbi:hypothetical protein GIB67_025616 [Kingdonia uniflora]|uniref:Cytochrome P450 n=1 Tax=Kingdonia uniflora TaxID=39325 RepID=A0A7J7L8B2_9MAGN|nr:hypothetical protein GIB67_025616 [Kingdonia uniflora]